MSEARVLVYSLSMCSPCKELKRSLQERGVQFEEVMLDDLCPQVKNMMRHLFVKRTGYRFVPVVEVILGTEQYWISNEGQEHIQEKVVQQITQLVKSNS